MIKQKKQATYDKPSTIIGKDTILENSTLKSKSSVQINGKYYGDMKVEASLAIGETGYIKGNIEADFLLVAGKIDGNLKITGQLHLTKTAKITGDINTASIIIDEGAHIDGKCSMSNVKNNVNQIVNNKDKSIENKNKDNK
ncbi:bactofilin family protein [Vallitalea sp.]|jgi:cytoskeletal protein CcmA (bactofilin family)|uniref:bactofilin family protein n=1 Tax=Vallitalea sp. TaxID=1882829 RepID=UPI0025EC363A|nr:polymer-forming cytoskeletal protein [Vallitalea sp.]MCT4686148.1 polymer-forming cytoskeletal protein [Vallitalea sp.]